MLFITLYHIIVSAKNFERARSLLTQLCSMERFSQVYIDINRPCRYKQHYVQKFERIDMPISLIKNPNTNTGYKDTSGIWKAMYNITNDNIHRAIIDAIRFSTFVHISKMFYLNDDGTYSANPSFFFEHYKEDDLKPFRMLYDIISKAFSFYDFDFIALQESEKEIINEIKKNIRNYSMIKLSENRIHDMERCLDLVNCVSCAKCRLWGLLKFRGLICAIKLQNNRKDISFDDFVCFINFLDQLNIACDILKNDFLKIDVLSL